MEYSRTLLFIHRIYRASLVVGKESACRRLWFSSWEGKIPWRRDKLPTPVFLGFPGGWDGKESACNAGDLGSIPGLETPPGGAHGNPLQYSCLENPHGQKCLVGYSPWGCKELDMTEWLSTAQLMYNIVLVSALQQSDSVIHLIYNNLHLLISPNPSYAPLPCGNHTSVKPWTLKWWNQGPERVIST